MTASIHIPTQDEDLEFAYFLTRENWISERELETVQRKRAQARRPFGEVALHKRVLTPREVAKVLRQQAGSPTRFGEAAVALGVMTLDDVYWVLRLQREELPSVIDLILEHGFLSEEDLERARGAFDIMKAGPTKRTIPARSLSEMALRPPSEHPPAWQPPPRIPESITSDASASVTVRPPTRDRRSERTPAPAPSSRASRPGPDALVSSRPEENEPTEREASASAGRE